MTYRPTTAHKAITARQTANMNALYANPIKVAEVKATKEQIEAYKAKCNVKR